MVVRVPLSVQLRAHQPHNPLIREPDLVAHYSICLVGATMASLFLENVHKHLRSDSICNETTRTHARAARKTKT